VAAVLWRSQLGLRHNQLLLLTLLLLAPGDVSDAVPLYQLNAAHKASNYCVINSS